METPKIRKDYNPNYWNDFWCIIFPERRVKIRTERVKSEWEPDYLFIGEKIIDVWLMKC